MDAAMKNIRRKQLSGRDILSIVQISDVAEIVEEHLVGGKPVERLVL